jgi:uncharacterized membrane protein YwaF
LADFFRFHTFSLMWILRVICGVRRIWFARAVLEQSGIVPSVLVVVLLGVVLFGVAQFPLACVALTANSQ